MFLGAQVLPFHLPAFGLTWACLPPARMPTIYHLNRFLPGCVPDFLMPATFLGAISAWEVLLCHVLFLEYCCLHLGPGSPAGCLLVHHWVPPGWVRYTALPSHGPFACRLPRGTPAACLPFHHFAALTLGLVERTPAHWVWVEVCKLPFCHCVTCVSCRSGSTVSADLLLGLPAFWNLHLDYTPATCQITFCCFLLPPGCTTCLPGLPAVAVARWNIPACRGCTCLRFGCLPAACHVLPFCSSLLPAIPGSACLPLLDAPAIGLHGTPAPAWILSLPFAWVTIGGVPGVFWAMVCCCRFAPGFLPPGAVSAVFCGSAGSLLGFCRAWIIPRLPFCRRRFCRLRVCLPACLPAFLPPAAWVTALPPRARRLPLPFCLPGLPGCRLVSCLVPGGWVPACLDGTCRCRQVYLRNTWVAAIGLLPGLCRSAVPAAFLPAGCCLDIYLRSLLPAWVFSIYTCLPGFCLLGLDFPAPACILLPGFCLLWSFLCLPATPAVFWISCLHLLWTCHCHRPGSAYTIGFCTWILSVLDFRSLSGAFLFPTFLVFCYRSTFYIDFTAFVSGVSPAATYGFCLVSAGFWLLVSGCRFWISLHSPLQTCTISGSPAVLPPATCSACLRCFAFHSAMGGWVGGLCSYSAFWVPGCLGLPPAWVPGWVILIRFLPPACLPLPLLPPADSFLGSRCLPWSATCTAVSGWEPGGILPAILLIGFYSPFLLRWRNATSLPPFTILPFLPRVWAAPGPALPPPACRHATTLHCGACHRCLPFLCLHCS